METKTQPNWQNLKRNVTLKILGVYFLALGVLVAIALVVVDQNSRSLANVLTLAVRESLVVRDYRPAMVSLNKSLEGHLKGVEFRPQGEGAGFFLPGPLEVAALSRWDYGRVTVPVPLNDQGTHAGELDFYFDRLRGVPVALAAWAIIGILSFPLVLQSFQSARRRYLSILRFQEAEAKSRLAEQVSHDIRSPLSALNTALSGPLDQERMELVASATERINSIAGELLESAKANVLAPAQETIKQVVAEKNYGRTPVVFCSLQESPILLSKDGLARVVSNLINNSMAALGENGRVDVELRSDGKKVILAVKDNGKGMSSSQLELVGQRGFSTRQTGHGLGLAHARDWAEKNGGYLKMESHLGKGTTITLVLPRT